MDYRENIDYVVIVDDVYDNLSEIKNVLHMEDSEAETIEDFVQELNDDKGAEEISDFLCFEGLTYSHGLLH